MAASVVSRLPVRYQEMPSGPNWVDHTVSIPTTSLDDVGDDVLCFLFPSEAYLDGQSLHCKFSDMDSATSLAHDVGIGDSDGAIDTTLISAGVAGQTGAYDEADAIPGGTLIEKYIDVSNKYMIVSVETAAGTAVAGTIKFNFAWSHQPFSTATTS